MDSLKNRAGEPNRTDHLEAVMVAFAKALGAAPREASALAAAIAKGPDRPEHEREAMARVRRAVLATGSEDDADRAMLATWLARRERNVNLDRLPCAGPGVSGLPMPPQDLDGSLINGFAGAFKLAPRTRALRSDT